MKKAAAILAWATSAAIISTISVGTAIALDPDCHAAYNKFWKKIHEPRKLDHKPSKETIRKWTAYNKEMLHKLDIACEVFNVDVFVKNDLAFDAGLFGSDTSASPASIPDMASNGRDFLDTEETQLASMIPEREYPVYDSPSISYAGGWGGWLGGGGFNPNYPQTPPSGGSPLTPIVPIPEPLPFSLVMIGAAFIVVRRRK